MAEGKKQRKFGRNSRAPSNGNQKFRTAANKERAAKNDGIRRAKAAEKRLRSDVTKRGEARRKRRNGLTHQLADAYRKAGLAPMASFDGKVSIPSM